MSDRIHFAHPDEEATFNRCRVYYVGCGESRTLRAVCDRCGVVANDQEPHRGLDHHDACEALRGRLAADGWTMRCGFDFCPACSGEESGNE